MVEVYNVEKSRRDKEPELKERVIHVNRVDKVVKGGRRFSFSALVVVGDGKGSVGLGYGKASEVSSAIRKSIEHAKKNIFLIPLAGNTIPHEIFIEKGAAKILMKPASRGTGVIAGGAIRAIFEVAGVKDILAKSLGTSNLLNVAKATVVGLQSLRNLEAVAKLRGKDPKEIL